VIYLCADCFILLSAFTTYFMINFEVTQDPFTFEKIFPVFHFVFQLLIFFIVFLLLITKLSQKMKIENVFVKLNRPVVVATWCFFHFVFVCLPQGFWMESFTSNLHCFWRFIAIFTAFRLTFYSLELNWTLILLQHLLEKLSENCSNKKAEIKSMMTSQVKQMKESLSRSMSLVCCRFYSYLLLLSNAFVQISYCNSTKNFKSLLYWF